MGEAQRRFDEFYNESPPGDESISLALRDILEELKTLNDTLKTILEVKEWGAK